LTWANRTKEKQYRRTWALTTVELAVMMDRCGGKQEIMIRRKHTTHDGKKGK
jgi:hypothetical protein